MPQRNPEIVHDLRRLERGALNHFQWMIDRGEIRWRATGIRPGERGVTGADFYNFVRIAPPRLWHIYISGGGLEFLRWVQPLRRQLYVCTEEEEAEASQYDVVFTPVSDTPRVDAITDVAGWNPEDLKELAKELERELISATRSLAEIQVVVPDDEEI